MSKKVLLVDDSGLARRSTRRILEGAGYEVVVADLVCAGNLGLLEAPKRFRLDAGAAFVTAAYRSVEKEIRAHAKWLRRPHAGREGD